MDATKSQPPRHPPDGSVSDSLGSWKEIAAYLKRDERTVRRWQKEGLPVHRHMHKKQASVYAFRSQLDLWWRRDRNRLEAAEAATKQQSQRHAWFGGFLAVAVLFLGLLGANAFGLRERWMRDNGPASITLAVLPLKNLSGDLAQDYYADGLTEALITELGRIARFQVVSFQSAS